MQIHYDGKYSKQLFREVLTRELVQYDRDKEAFSNIDCMKYEKKTVGEEHCMVDNNYLVVISFLIIQIILLASAFNRLYKYNFIDITLDSGNSKFLMQVVKKCVFFIFV